MYTDELATEIKQKVVGIEQIIFYADDIAVCRNIYFPHLQEVIESFSFKLNPKKCASFRKSMKGIPKRRTYKYLGIIINDRGLATGKTKIVKELKVKAKKLGKIGPKNPHKGLLLLLSLCGGLINFHLERQPLYIHPGTLVKHVLKLNPSLDNNMAAQLALTILKKPKNTVEEYSKSIIALTKYNGVLDMTGKRVITKWSPWYSSVDRVLQKINEIKNKLKPKTKKTKKKNPETKKKTKTTKLNAKRNNISIKIQSQPNQKE